jgi:hypothetical protein
MSEQISDKFIFNNKEYELSAIEFPQNFLDFSQFKLEPMELNTACWRGFISTFAVINNKLMLDEIYTNNGNKKEFIIPEINGKKPKIEIPDNLVESYADYKILNYTNIKYVMNYTGAIIIASKFIDKYYVHMGFKSPINFKNIIKLKFINGDLTDVNDLSKIGAKISKNRKRLSEGEQELDVIHRLLTDVDVFFNNDIDELFKEIML